MRILIVTHRYPPCYSAGTERYSEALAKGLVARGHEVHVCCAEKDVSQRDYSLVRRVHRGVEVHEIINNLFYDSFNETYQNPSVEAVFASVLEVVRPDVVHVQHLMYLSVGCLGLAADSGARVVMTLHDFGLECARMGQLLHVDGGLCETVEFERCGSCLVQTPWNQSAGARMVGNMLGAVRRATGLDLAPRVTRLARKSGAVGAGAAAKGTADASKTTDAESHATWARAAEARSSALVQAVQRHARHVFAPSRFLADRCLALGLDPGRVEFLPTGVQRVEAADVSKASHPQERRGPLAVLFLGTLVPAKGAHVLLEAYGRLNTEQRAGIDLRIFGPEGSDESYHKGLVQKAQQLGLQVGKPLPPHKVQAALAGADLLVVPSIWLENRPLVILEALSMGVPCLVSGSGGMAELVQPGRDGWWFDLGDAGDLARVLGERSADPEGTRSLRPLAPDLPTFDATVQRIEEVYLQLLASEEDSS
jgi:glycosyltransferase involved in cell wall biosynthesis